MRHGGLEVREHHVETADGWSLHMRRSWAPATFDPQTRPMLIIPGYGMNSFIFSFHPRGTSLERCLAEGGFEVWAVDLRAQGESRPSNGRAAGSVSLENYAAIDVPAAVERVLRGTRTNADRVTLVGCSLGGSISYGALALVDHLPVAELITMGAPLRWDEVHPLIKTAFRFPALASVVRVKGTRRMLRAAAPLMPHAPGLLSMYMNTRTIDMERMAEMTRTVEDPDPAINRDIAEWVNRGDLLLGGVNITRAMRDIEVPLLVVLSNRDGIVPEPTAMSVVDAWGGPDVEVLRVGSDDNWYAHANLFIANDAPTLVFDPIIRWLRRVKLSVAPPAP